MADNIRMHSQIKANKMDYPTKEYIFYSSSLTWKPVGLGDGTDWVQVKKKKKKGNFKWVAGRSSQLSYMFFENELSYMLTRILSHARK